MIRKVILILVFMLVVNTADALDEVISVQGINVAPTRTIVSTDAVQFLPGWISARGDGKAVSAVLFTCETNPIRWTVGGSTPSRVGNGRGHILYAQQSLRIVNRSMIRTFRFTSETGGSAAVLQVTAEYNN